MTTDELVNEIIVGMLCDIGAASERYEKHLRLVTESGDENRFSQIYSIALNDETRDVRFIRVDGGGFGVKVVSVTPETVVQTVYRP